MALSTQGNENQIIGFNQIEKPNWYYHYYLGEIIPI